MTAYRTRNGWTQDNDPLADGEQAADNKTGAELVREAIVAERAKATVAELLRRHNRSPVAVLMDTRDAMAEAIAYRMGGPEPEMPEAERYAEMSFHAQVESLLTMRRVPWSGRTALVERGIGTGDVPALLEGAGNRVLRKAFASYAAGLQTVASRVPSRDFRDVKLIQVDGDIALKEIPEGAPFTYGTLQASAETYPISTFGRAFGLSHTLLLDDDLGAFANLAEQLGQAAAEFVSGKLATLLEANGNLSDGTALFAAGHANLGSAGALAEGTLGELMKLMRAQTGLGGERISVVPHALVVPGALELTARKLITLLGNPLAVVVEPRLTSATAYYLAAAPESGTGLSLTFPMGSEAPVIELGRRPGYRGLQGKVRLDFGCGIADHRGLAKNAGG